MRESCQYITDDRKRNICIVMNGWPMIMTKPLPFPPPVTICGLKMHFENTYQLGTEQVELMIDSSRKSLEKILGDARVVLQSEHACKELVNIGHSLKGLMLNMGEPEWAEVARDLERSARLGERRDYAALIAGLTEGVRTVLMYKRKH